MMLPYDVHVLDIINRIIYFIRPLESQNSPDSPG